ncbi:MAG: hypothetical protein H8E98_05950 [Bacteroidetes bacterium]|nr:hypothetical protein [Bacteroidota bacterium]
MKSSHCMLLYVFLFLGINYLAIEEANCQDNQAQNQDLENWRHHEKYTRIIQQSIFSAGMSDDEMAGIELWRGGRNLKMSFAFMIVGIGIASTATWLPDRFFTSKYKGKIDPEDIQIAIAIVGGGFLIASICELVSGYNKIGKAGIILQHKKFTIKTTGNNISLNF